MKLRENWSITLAAKDVLRRLWSSAKTINQLNQSIIAFENIITPAEARTFNSDMEARANPETNVWFSREAEWRTQFAELSSVTGFSYSHDFVRVWNRPSATLFRSKGFSPRTPRRLVVLFTGGLNRMMVPSWVFLAHLPRRPAYVLMLRGGWEFYVAGLPGLSNDFSSTVEWIRDFAEAEGLTIDTVMGSSGGSLPASRAGHALGARRRLLFGLPRVSDDEIARFPLTGDIGRSSEPMRDRGRGLTLFAGGEHARDIETAAEARRRLPRAKVVVVNGADHNVVEPLARQGELHRLLKKHSGTRLNLWS